MAGKIYDSDDFILKMLASDDKQAINILYLKHHAHLFKITSGLTHDREAAKDILQDLFFTVWERRHQLKITKPIKAYLVKAAIHRSYNFIRDKSRHQTIPLQGHETWGQLKNGLPSSIPLELEELRNLIKSAIQGLPPKSKVAFILSRRHDMSYQEIAAHLEISKKTVEKHISKALKYLDKILKPYLKSILILMTL